MRSRETLMRIMWQMVAGVMAIITGAMYVVTDTKGYLGVGGTVILFVMVGGALACLDGIIDIIGEFKCDPDYRRRFYEVDEEP